jgi:hypothetical protein
MNIKSSRYYRQSVTLFPPELALSFILGFQYRALHRGKNPVALILTIGEAGGGVSIPSHYVIFYVVSINGEGNSHDF